MTAPYSSHNLIAFGAYPDDVEAVMGGTVVKPVEKASSLLVVDLCDGELARHAGGSERARQAKRAARILGVGRVTLSLQDRLIQDSIPARLAVARLIRVHEPSLFFTTLVPHGAMLGLLSISPSMSALCMT